MHCSFVFFNLLKYNRARRIIIFIYTNEIFTVSIFLCAFPKVPHKSNSEDKRIPKKSQAIKYFCFVSLLFFKSVTGKTISLLPRIQDPKVVTTLGILFKRQNKAVWEFEAEN